MQTYFDQLENRYSETFELEKDVKSILNHVKEAGDKALRLYTKRWDKASITQIKVNESEVESALQSIDPSLLAALEQAKMNIEKFHQLQLSESQFIEKDGSTIGELIRPIESVGIYVPGGKAAYPSSVLMNAVPAKLAGVDRLVMVTPPQADGQIKDSVLVAAHLAGVDEIYKVGGAQSIGALTYGTASVKPVKKIVGPGNIYVALAKKMVSDRVGIDMIAGPSEVLILADDQSNPRFIAADMIAQAEHDERAAALVITSDETLVTVIQSCLEEQLKEAPRKDIIQRSLDRFGAIILVNSRKEMVQLANHIAPEHLELMVKNPDELVREITSAGAIFVGDYSPEALGDYYAGPNHTLPTSGTAKFASPLSVNDFVKKTSYIKYDYKSLKRAKTDIVTIARDEGLFGHANSVRVRFEEV